MKKRTKLALIIVGSFVGAFAFVCCFFAIANAVVHGNNLERVRAINRIIYNDDFLTPYMDEGTRCWTFETDREFKVLQLTDIHIGDGIVSVSNDKNAIATVEKIVKAAKPDLVIATGDMAFPFFFQSGTTNNKREATIFAELMENLGVYWCVAFGNHDTESYALYTREDITALYMSYPHCLMQAGPKDIAGCGNYAVNVVNSSKQIVQTLYVLDSNDYHNRAISSKYDHVHKNQVEWYKGEVARMNQINARRGGGDVKSLMFFHIPFIEYEKAFETETVDFGQKGEGVCYGNSDGDLFAAILEAGSTQGTFCGHDHVNTYSVEYQGVRLTYGMSIDYLAYIGIGKKTEQRGGTVITVATDGTFKVEQLPLTSIS